MGLDSGKHGGGHGRYDRRDYYQADYSDYSASSTLSENCKRTASVRFAEPADSEPAALQEFEKKLTNVQKDFAKQLQSMSEKDTEKFDLIFAILTDLQSGQEQIEESIRDIRKAVGGAQNMGNNGQFQYLQMEGVLGPPLGPGMGGQQPQPMQQIVIQPNGGQAMMMPQMVMVVQSPTGGMMIPQMQPMQPMQQQVMLVGQSPVGQEMSPALGGCGAVAGEQCADGGEGQVPLLADLGKHEGSDVDSTDTPTTGLSE
mmetsp:Transcript_43871/g.114079  ORF Transcript_43871/g.114079 Transcript_43871/m.114079 type:complete len:257 (-) Transcript_43871:83-853(-)